MILGGLHGKLFVLILGRNWWGQVFNGTDGHHILFNSNSTASVIGYHFSYLAFLPSPHV
jgi:hypothetical protein